MVEQTSFDHVYFVWFDPDKKYSQKKKLADAINNFTRRVGASPTEILVNRKDAELPSSIPLRPAEFVKENYYYIPYPSR